MSVKCPGCGRYLKKEDVAIVTTYLMFVNPTIVEKKEAYCPYCGRKLGEKRFADKQAPEVV